MYFSLTEEYMGYSTPSEVDQILAQALTSSRPDSTQQRIQLINVGNTRSSNSIPNTVVEYYISLADSEIDGILSQMYKTPLKECVYGQWELDADINEYSESIEVTTTINLVPGNIIIIRDDDTGLEI